MTASGAPTSHANPYRDLLNSVGSEGQRELLDIMEVDVDQVEEGEEKGPPEEGEGAPEEGRAPRRDAGGSGEKNNARVGALRKEAHNAKKSLVQLLRIHLKGSKKGSLAQLKEALEEKWLSFFSRATDPSVIKAWTGGSCFDGLLQAGGPSR